MCNRGRFRSQSGDKESVLSASMIPSQIALGWGLVGRVEQSVRLISWRPICFHSTSFRKSPKHEWIIAPSTWHWDLTRILEVSESTSSAGSRLHELPKGWTLSIASLLGKPVGSVEIRKRFIWIIVGPPPIRFSLFRPDRSLRKSCVVLICFR